MSDETPSHYMSPEKRYEQDQAFKSLVDAFQLIIHKTRFSQEEMKDALLLATKKDLLER